ncbi:MAG: hypothetical protein IKB93_02775 [Clostridia bacterium]|nr:hypothetical protein [Clostridia bacterium]
MKKKAMCTILSATMLAGLTVQPVSAEASKLGDVNTDGKVTVSDVITLSRYVAEDTSLILDDAALANADADYDGIVTAADCTSILRAIAGLEPLTDVPVRIDCLYSFIMQTYNFEESSITGQHSLQCAVDSMHVVTNEKEYEALMNKGYPYFGGSNKQFLETGVAMLATSVEQSENVTLSLREVFKYQGKFVFLVDRTKPQGEDEGPLAHFNLTFIIDKDDYNGESAVVYYTDMITVNNTLCESFTTGALDTRATDSLGTQPEFAWITSHDVLSSYCLEWAVKFPNLLKYDDAFFQENCLLFAEIPNGDSKYLYHTNALNVAEDGSLHWQIDRMLSFNTGGSFMHRDLLAIPLPKSYINSDITYEVTNVDWIP